MRFFISEQMLGGDIHLREVLRTLVAGAVCITAIVKCGIMAVVIIATLAVLNKVIEV